MSDDLYFWHGNVIEPFHLFDILSHHYTLKVVILFVLVEPPKGQDPT